MSLDWWRLARAPTSSCSTTIRSLTSPIRGGSRRSTCADRSCRAPPWPPDGRPSSVPLRRGRLLLIPALYDAQPAAIVLVDVGWRYGASYQERILALDAETRRGNTMRRWIVTKIGCRQRRCISAMTSGDLHAQDLRYRLDGGRSRGLRRNQHGDGRLQAGALGRERSRDRDRRQTQCRLQLGQWPVGLGHGRVSRDPRDQTVARNRRRGTRGRGQGVQPAAEQRDAGFLTGQGRARYQDGRAGAVAHGKRGALKQRWGIKKTCRKCSSRR